MLPTLEPGRAFQLERPYLGALRKSGATVRAGTNPAIVSGAVKLATIPGTVRWYRVAPGIILYKFTRLKRKTPVPVPVPVPKSVRSGAKDVVKKFVRSLLRGAAAVGESLKVFGGALITPILLPRDAVEHPEKYMRIDQTPPEARNGVRGAKDAKERRAGG